MQSTSQQKDIKEHRQLKNNEFFKTAIRRISKTHYFFPTDQLLSFSCISKCVQNIDNFTETLHEVCKSLCAFGYLIKVYK